MYFDKFPQTLYNFNVKDGAPEEFKLILDITANIRFKQTILDAISVYEFYYLNEGETIENVSEKLYGDANYNWVLMLFNEKFDYIEDFPLAADQLEEFVTDTYGAGHEHDIHHWELNGLIVDQSTPNSVSVDNFAYEWAENESKRQIKVLSPGIMQVVAGQLNNLF
jgi:hypothetical protein